MAGHNKWSKIKRKKAAEDKKRGKLFSKLSQAIEQAARKGGGDLDTNLDLRSAVDEAKDANMPSDTIERAIKKGTGELEDAAPTEERYYEAYGPGGVALLIRTSTDNANRTSAELKHILSTHNTALAGAGSVQWMFEKSWDEDNVQMTPKSTVPLSDKDEKALDKLIEDLEDHQDVEQVFTNKK